MSPSWCRDVTQFGRIRRPFVDSFGLLSDVSHDPFLSTRVHSHSEARSTLYNDPMPHITPGQAAE